MKYCYLDECSVWQHGQGFTSDGHKITRNLHRYYDAMLQSKPGSPKKEGLHGTLPGILLQTSQHLGVTCSIFEEKSNYYKQ